MKYAAKSKSVNKRNTNSLNTAGKTVFNSDLEILSRTSKTPMKQPKVKVASDDD